MKMKTINKLFSGIANAGTRWFGAPIASMLAIIVVFAWLIGGFFIKGGLLNSTYELFFQSGLAIVTFIMVFFIQHSTNVGDTALQLKVDHIIAKLQEADNRFIAIEEKAEPDLKIMKEELMQNLEK